MIKLAKTELCTGCGVCASKCPKSCILMKENSIGIVLPEIDTSACVDCHACEKVCPILNELPLFSSKKAFAAWSNNEEERRTSASGGIAAEMYKMAVDMGYKIVGAVQQEDFSVEHEISDSKEIIPAFKNSKYVFSSAYKVFDSIKKLLKERQKVLFIGLPCQVAALRKLCNDNGDLLLVDVVCHGTTPVSYLRQHINMLNEQTGNVAHRMSFRDPDAYTCTYTFTLYNDENKRFYAKRTKDGDTYQFGYHRAVSYRESCFHCRFAKPERDADVTIADYSGLGIVKPAPYDANNVSLILENTEKGHCFIERMIAEKRITADERPLQEPFKGNAQLRHPLQKNMYRRIFEKEIKKYEGDFEKAIKRSHKKYVKREKIKELSKHVIKIIKTFKIK